MSPRTCRSPVRSSCRVPRVSRFSRRPPSVQQMLQGPVGMFEQPAVSRGSNRAVGILARGDEQAAILVPVGPDHPRLDEAGPRLELDRLLGLGDLRHLEQLPEPELAVIDRISVLVERPNLHVRHSETHFNLHPAASAAVFLPPMLFLPAGAPTPAESPRDRIPAAGQNDTAGRPALSAMRK